MEEVDLTRVLLSFVFVLALIGCLPLILRYAGKLKNSATLQGQGSRLQVVETRYLDPKRRLVLIKRDDREHLLLLSYDREIIVESGIQYTPASMPTACPANDHE